MMKIYFILAFLFIFGNIACQVTNLYLDLKYRDEECLYEYFPDKTLVIYEVFSNISNVRCTIKNPEDQVIAEKFDEHFKHAFTTYSGGYYELCMENKNITSTSSINFSLKYGVAAKDYSSVAKSKDLKPLDLDLEKLDDKTKELSHYIAFATAHESMFEYTLDGISSKIAFFSAIIIGVMIFIGLVETIYLKKYMEKRKII